MQGGLILFAELEGSQPSAQIRGSAQKPSHPILGTGTGDLSRVTLLSALHLQNIPYSKTHRFYHV